MTGAHEILKKYWGFSGFRPSQEEIIQKVLQGKDTLAILPTGGGKSICFQVPALMMDGLCLVVSPLIALMKDQVENLAAKGIPALTIYSGMNYFETKEILRKAAFGDYKFLYVSPERLQSSLFLEYLPALKPSLVAVDEAHCISQWGYDFRPSYLQIANLRKELPTTQLIALTASATPKVETDICEKLLFTKGYGIFRSSFARPGLSYNVTDPPAKQSALVDLLKDLEGSAIVYCRSRKQTKDIADILKLHGISCDYYHAGLTQEERSERQTSWLKGTTRVIVCTNAFGMGIDKPDVRMVIHFGTPDSPENYYQEAGRAGRDGKYARAVLLSNKSELKQLYDALDTRFPSPERIRELYTALMNYLQVAAGTGEEMYFDFDIAAFSSSFKVGLNEANYAVQTFARDGILSFSEGMFRPSSIQFLVSKEYLNEYTGLYPGKEDVILALLRSYEGIFNHPSFINEKKLASFTGKSQEEIIQQLEKLQLDGIIEYQQKNEKPRIYLLKNRMYSDDFSFDFKGLAERKASWLERVKAMEEYITTNECRSMFLAGYFGDSSPEPCGICDNCVASQSKDQRGIDREMILLTSSRQMTIRQLRKALEYANDEIFWKHFNFLESEGYLETGKDGIIRVTGKGIK